MKNIDSGQARRRSRKIRVVALKTHRLRCGYYEPHRWR
jgi:hypothetical protein